MAPSKTTLPRHVAIIMDGNGRWAKRHSLEIALGHRRGVETLRDVVRYSSDIGIGVLSLYAFSTENWKRSGAEVAALMGLVLEFFKSEINELNENQVRIRILGDVEALPTAQRDAVRSAEQVTQGNQGLQLNIALNYGGRDEIVAAARELAKMVRAEAIEPEQITAELFESMLYTKGQPDVDLLIRTSGEMRLSNFLLYQNAYAEMSFPDVLWPDFSVAHYQSALDAFGKRDRRYGGRKT